jgi:glycosyltransferase involved in cell wall biosynthesis
MLDVRRLILPKSRQDRRAKTAFSVRADLLGRVDEVVFVPRGAPGKICSNGRSVLVDIGRDDKVYFTYPEVRPFRRAPEHSAFPLKGGAQYIFSGSVDVLGGSQVSAVLTYFDADHKVAYQSTPLTTGGFTIEANVPATTEKATLGFRVKGPACFAVRSLSLTEVPPVDLTEEPRSAVMIVLNDIVHDGRVLKTAQTLLDRGYSVTLLGMWRTPNSALMATRIAGARALIFPNPSSFLRNARVRALNWEHTVAYLRATMWHYVERVNPRFIHTHDYHTVPLGFEFTRRLRELGRQVHWLHDFHEYVPGYDHMEADWQDAILAHEDRAMHAMDHRFTVSPLIATWLKERHRLAEAPTVVLNTPSREALSVAFDRTARRDLRLAADVDLIVYTGGVSELRGLHTVVEALAANRGWHLVLVTNDRGPYIARLKQIAAEGGYGDRLHLLRYVKPDEVAAYVRDASIGIMPFRRYGNTDASLPNKLYDYLHAGLPMAASNCTLIQEFLERWQVGEVFKEGDVRDCAETIGRVLARAPSYRANIRAHPELLRECTWEEQARKILDAYEMLEPASSLEPRAALSY